MKLLIGEARSQSRLYWRALDIIRDDIIDGAFSACCCVSTWESPDRLLNPSSASFTLHLKHGRIESTCIILKWQRFCTMPAGPDDLTWKGLPDVSQREESPLRIASRMSCLSLGRGSMPVGFNCMWVSSHQKPPLPVRCLEGVDNPLVKVLDLQGTVGGDEYKAHVRDGGHLHGSNMRSSR